MQVALGQVYWETDRRQDAHRLWQEVLPELHQVAVENLDGQALEQQVASLQREICARYGAVGLWDPAATPPQSGIPKQVPRITIPEMLR